MGSKQKMDFRQCQLDAFVAVLKALSSGKLDWSKQKLLTDLRKQLNISQDEYLQALDAVLKDPEVIALRDAKPLPEARENGEARNRPGQPAGADVFPTPHALQREPRAPAPLRGHNRILGPRGPSRKRSFQQGPGRGRGRRSHRSPPSLPRTVDQLIGRKVERYVQKPREGWVHAIVTDHDTGKGTHCIVFNFNMKSKETWEWVNVKQELEEGRLRIPPGVPLDLNAVVPSQPVKQEDLNGQTGPNLGVSVSELHVPFDDGIFRKYLETGSLPELEKMYENLMKRHRFVLDKLIGMGDAAADDPLVSALIEKAKLERSEVNLKTNINDQQHHNNEAL